MREEPPRRSMWGGGVDFPSRGQTLGLFLSQRRASTGERCSTWLLLANGVGQGGGACVPTWVLEGQATIAWVLLELDLFQGEDGGS